MRLNGLKEWGSVEGVPVGSFRGNFGRDQLERHSMQRATLVFATACMFFALAVIALMLLLAQ